mmetsp:Transcript_11854/g.15808  ORF Transcript_11854/g.15808 Transcript_11854/m.15808 type:complete len:148 (+) Transcript_11854:70-513(+)
MAEIEQDQQVPFRRYGRRNSATLEMMMSSITASNGIVSTNMTNKVNQSSSHTPRQTSIPATASMKMADGHDGSVKAMNLNNVPSIRLTKVTTSEGSVEITKHKINAGHNASAEKVRNSTAPKSDRRIVRSRVRAFLAKAKKRVGFCT